MRILYSHRTRSSDGQYVHIEAMARALTAVGHEVMLCGPEGTAMADTVARPLSAGETGSPHRRSLSSRIPFGAYELAELAYNVSSTRALMAAAERFKPDVLYERYNLFHHAGIAVQKRLGLPRLVEINAPLVAERKENRQLRLTGMGAWSEQRIWTTANACLPVTGVLADIVMTAGVPEERIHVIANGVDEDTLTPADGRAVRSQFNLHADDLVLGFVGFVRPWHGVDRVIQWLALAEGRAAHLLIVGDGPAVPDLVDQAHALGVADRVHVTGVVQRTDVAAHVAAFDIALQPAVTPYASPLKLQEYMAQARAIIAPNMANIRETVTDGTDAVLVPPEDRAALHAALSRLSTDHALRERLGAAAREKVLRDDRTWTANARRVADLAAMLKEQP